MITRTLPLLAVGGVLALAAGSASAAHMGYTLSDNGDRLVVFDIITGDVVASRNLVGAGTRLDDLDFRPNTGQLFGYDDSTDTYFTVNTITGVLTNVTAAAVPTTSRGLGIDWNPTIDRMRTVTDGEQNIVYNPLTMTASDVGITPLFYAAGDVNDGVNPNIVANGYTNSFAGNFGMMGTTVQYVLDSDLNALATLANNAGTLTTIGTVTIGGIELDFGGDAGLDIFFTPEMTNIAYALLNVGGVSGLYTINLADGSATFIGDIGLRLKGLAVGVANDVPEPAALALFGLGLAGLLAARRRRG